MDIGKKIKELREEKELSQAQLAKKINVSQKAIDFWEKDINEPKASYIHNLATFFNVTSDYILGLEDEFGNKIDQNDAQPPKTITNIKAEEKPKLKAVARSKGNTVKIIEISEEEFDELLKNSKKV